MILPDLSHEKKLWSQGHETVAGIDEVGVGPLAGPVCACCVVLKPGFCAKKAGLEKLRDSKMLTFKQREKMARILKKHHQVRYSLAMVAPKKIDSLNIYNASHQAMKMALSKLRPKPTFALIDGRALLRDVSIAQKAVVKGDQKIFSIAAASVLAKVSRDNYMLKLAKKYPCYLFEKHKGYATKLHRKLVLKYGPSPVHRLSFLKFIKH